MLSETLATALVTLMQATGKIRNYQLAVGGFQMLNFPLTYWCYSLGATVESIFVVAICISIVCEMTRLIMLKKIVKLPMKEFIKNIYFKVLMVAIVSSFLPLTLKFYYFQDNFYSFIILTALSIVCVAMASYTIGCTKNDRLFIKKMIMKIKKIGKYQ